MIVPRRFVMICAVVAAEVAPCAGSAGAQTVAVSPFQLELPQGQAAAPTVITLSDAMERARANDAPFQAAMTDAKLAGEDRVQARASLLPAFSASTQYVGTKGDTPLPTGRFVSSNGVNLYRAWLVAHEEISPNMLTPQRRASAAEALAMARLEIARRGLAVTVTERYYALVTAERKYAAGQQASQQAQRFRDIAQQQQRLGQVAQADVIKAEIQFRQQEQAYRDARLQMESRRLQLAVLLFPTLNENFTVVDDLTTAPALPDFSEARSMAEKENPGLRGALAALHVAEQDVRSAQNAFLPTFVIDAAYGIEANAFALHSRSVADPELGVVPNLGYLVTLNLSIPVWDWGSLRSKLHQSSLRANQAQIEATQAQRQLVSDLYSRYNEAVAARASSNSTQGIVDLAAESLRLTNLRYQAGESTALEVIDAQNTLIQARDAYDAALSRYRVALAGLQTVTGPF
jgi:outer membrane protein TolC